ncbi:MAG: hypothetical protein AAGA70_11360 [Pseudomonadota bacterium]
MDTEYDVPAYALKSLIERYGLPADSDQTVRTILATLSGDDAVEERQVFARNCYRNDPNDPRYDANGQSFPRVSKGAYVAGASIKFGGIAPFALP